MARYTGPDCKLCRREKTKLFLKGAKCDSPKCPIEIRPYPPGEHGRNRPKEGDYLQQIREKQKARRIYGILERQFHGYYEEAARKHGRTGETMLQLLERRLDNVVFRAGFAKSRDMARQLVRHGHLTVNGKKVDIPSYRVSENDIVEVAPSPGSMTPFVVAQAEVGERRCPPGSRLSPTRCASWCTRCRSGRRSTPRSRSSSSSSTTRSKQAPGWSGPPGPRPGRGATVAARRAGPARTPRLSYSGRRGKEDPCLSLSAPRSPRSR